MSSRHILGASLVLSWTEALATCAECQSVRFVNKLRCSPSHTFQKQLRKKNYYSETLHHLAHVPFNIEHRGNT